MDGRVERDHDGSLGFGLFVVPVVHEFEDGGGGFLDAAAGDVDGGPAAGVAEAASPKQFFFDGFEIDVIAVIAAGEAGFHAGADHFQTMAADVDEGFGVDGQADDRAAGILEKVQWFDAGNQRDVGGFDAAIGEVEAGGGFGGAGDADQHDIGFFHAAMRLAVIMADDVVHGVDPAEIIRVQHVLAAGFVFGRQIQMRLEKVEHRIEDVKQRDVHAGASGVQLRAQGVIDQGTEDGAGFGLYPLQNAMELQAGANEGPAVIGDRRVVKLRGGGAGEGGQSVTRCIRDQVDIQFIRVHGGYDSGDCLGWRGDFTAQRG